MGQSLEEEMRRGSDTTGDDELSASSDTPITKNCQCGHPIAVYLITPDIRFIDQPASSH